jgi:PilZ domain
MPTDNIEEKRRFQRALYKAEAVLHIAGQALACKIADISLKGCLLELEQPLPVEPGDRCTLSFSLSDELSIVMDIGAVRINGGQAAFICQNIDLDSITSLRRLVELNVGDSQLLERDLSALSHFSDD